MKKLAILISLVLALFVTTPAQEPVGYSGSFYYDLSTRQTSAVVLRTLTTFNFGSLTLDLDAFGGATLDDGDLLAGFLLGKRFRLDRESRLQAYVGSGIRVQEGKPVSGGFAVGLTVRF